MDVNLYFEASSKWPENLTAIQEAKVEFLLDFDRRLRAAHDKLATYLGRENRNIGIENLAFLDVVYESGAAFRLRIYCDLEETLLQRQVANKSLDPQVREEATQALATLNWYSATLPLHTQTIATFCTRLHPLSQSIRLVKQWFISHKLSGHFSDELMELFVLHVFLQPYPWTMPSSPMAGFLRTLDCRLRGDHFY
jgi:U3 small nucleolar RNA-associated protein 22